MAAADYVVLLITLCYLANWFVELRHARKPTAAAARTATMAAAAGFALHTLYLIARAAGSDASPLSSPYDWCLLAGWVLVAAFFYLVSCYPKAAVGLFVMPLVLALVAASQAADQQPFAPVRASFFWGTVHGVFLLLGTVTVMIGFIAGLMYLVQSYRLKHKLPPTEGFRLPSLERLQRINSRAILVSVLLIGIGFFSGLILNTIKQREAAGGALLWTDPVIVSSGLMLCWLILASGFALFYRAAREGQKVAYLTLASFVFLAASLFAILFGSSRHIPSHRDAVNRRHASAPSTASGRTAARGSWGDAS